MKNTNLLKSVSFLFFVICSTLQGWGQTFNTTSPENKSITTNNITVSSSNNIQSKTFNGTASTKVWKVDSNPTSITSTTANIYKVVFTACNNASGTSLAKSCKVSVSTDGSTYNTLSSGVSVSGGTGTSSSNTAGIYVSGYGGYNTVTVTFNSALYRYVRIEKDGKETWINSIKVYTAPTALAKGTATETTCPMTITDGGNTLNYEFYYSTSSTTPASGTSATATFTSKTPELTSLTASTTYYCWVRSKYSDSEKSPWKALTGDTFTTEAPLNTYFYRGDDNDWGATAMTISTGGMYEYIASTSSSNKFKIALAADSWDYNKDYNWSGFFMTDQDINLGDWGGDNCYIWDAPASYYIIVFKPNTSVNSSSNPHICVSTTLPDDSPSGLAATKTVYLDPGVWETSNAQYAICYVEHNGEWSRFMTESPCFDGVYQTTIPAWVSNVEIVRFSNDATDSDISYEGGKCWNYSGHLSSMPSGEARFTVSQTGGTWNDLNTSNWSTPDLPTYTISYNAGSTTSTGGNAITGSKDSESKTCGTDFTLPSSAVFTATGYTQTGWATSDGGSKAYNLGGSYTTEAAQIFYPYWTVQNYNLTWNLGGGTTTSAGTGIASGVSVNTTSSVAYGTSLTAPTVTKDYHTFSAWSPAVASTMPAAATTYTATWTANKYNVSTSLTNMSVSSGTTGTNAATYGMNYSLTLAATGDYVLPTTITVTIGGSAAPSGSYSYNYSTGVVTITGSYITGNIVITAAGEENVFRVTYSGNGNTGGTVPSDATAYDPDAEVTVAAGVPTKTNYTFVGWLNSVDNTIYRAGQAFTITAHTTLTAQWGGVNDSWGLWWFYNEDNRTTSGFGTNNITMGINQGSSNSFSAVTYQGLTASYRSGGQTPTASVIIPDRSTATLYYIGRGSSSRTVQLKQSSTVKYSFEPAASDGATGSISNIAAGTYTLTSSGNINWSVVAFKFHTPIGYDVKFQNGSVSPASVSGMPTNYSGVPSGKKIAAPVTDPTAANYIFGGWYTTSACSTAFDFANTTITADKIIYAKWTAKTAPTTSYTFTLSDPCADASPSATLSGSQSGWSYQLYKDGVASGDPKAGTGSALTWTSLGVGTYLVKTVETSTQASAQIGSSATVYASTSITSNLASSRSVNANVSTTVSITATGASPTYQWYTCNSDGTGKVAIDGKTTNTLSYAFTNADAPTKYICCVLTSTCGTITSNIQTVTITPTYLLTYDANGGSGAPAAAYRPATTAALSSTVPTRSNHQFLGWNTKSNGSGTRYAAGASFPMPAQATTLYAEWVESVTLTWNVQVNVEETTITTTSTSSSYTPRVAAPSNLALNNLTVTSDKKATATNKISTTKAKGGYISATFVVASGYKFTPTSMVLKTTAITEAKTIEVNVGSNSQTWSQPKSGSTPDEHTYTFAAASAITGTGTMKIYAYGGEDGTKGYRIGTPITLYGKVEPVTLTYVGGSGSNWNTTANWSPACIPTIDHDVVIEVPVDVNITNARAKSVVIYNNGSTKTGQLILDAGKELVVSRTVRKTTDGSSYTATGENDIVFNSTSGAGLGALVMGSHDGTNKATVNFTTRAAGTKDDNTSIAQYVGTPFNDENNILYNWYNSWIYGIAYEGGSIDWVRINEGEGMIPFRGYCVFSADGANHVYWEQGTLNATTDRTISGLNWQSGAGTANLNNENLLANSWMAPIYIKAMESSDFVNADATIYIFNSTSASEYESGGFAGNYDSYTVNTAETVIPAMQSFSVFTTGTGASVTLDYSRIVYEPAVAGTATPEPNKVISRERQGDTEANKLRIFVRTESGLGDMLYMWEREDFSEAFENGWDGRKMYGESYAPQLYAITPDGAMAVNCVPTYEGVLIGFRAGTDEQTYTFNFEYDADAEPLYLYDKYADAYTRVLSGNTYQFVANDYEAHARFSLTHYMPGVATGIEASATGDQNTEIRCQKILLNERILILRDGKLYDVTGKTVK